MKKILLVGTLIVPFFVHAGYRIDVPLKDIPMSFKNNSTQPNDSDNNSEENKDLGNWIITQTLYSEWVNVGELYDYEDEAPDEKLSCDWYDNSAMTEKDVEYTMYRYCYQDQERTPTVTETNDVTGQSRNRDIEVERQQIEVEDTKTGVGTRVDFEEYASPSGKLVSGNLEIIGSYSLDGVVTGSPIINNQGSRIYFHFVHNTTTNTYLIELIGKDDDYPPSTTSYQGTMFKAYDYFQDINSINYVDSNGKVARVWLGGGSRSVGYRNNYAIFSASIPAEQFNIWYNNPNVISKFRIHLKSLNK